MPLRTAAVSLFAFLATLAGVKDMTAERIRPVID
jgi:hypothetical protein